MNWFGNEKKRAKHRPTDLQTTVCCADTSDTLGKIAMKHHVAPQDLLHLNALQYPGVTLTSVLAKGTRVVLPRAALADWETGEIGGGGDDGGRGGGKAKRVEEEVDMSGGGGGASGSGLRMVNGRKPISARRNYYNDAQRRELQVGTSSSCTGRLLFLLFPSAHM